MKPSSAWGLRHAFVRTATQPVFLVVYACFLAHALEGFIIDLDHWRHFYLLLALIWGLMLGPLVLAAAVNAQWRGRRV